MADISAHEKRLLSNWHLPAWRRSRLIGYGFGLAAFLASFILRWALDPYLPPGLPFVTFFMAVTLTAFVAGLGPGIFVTVLTTVAAWNVFLPPAFSFALDRQGASALVLYVGMSAVNLAVIHLMQVALERLDRERARSAELAGQRELLFTELQHRVANNLQIVSALITVQKASMSDEAARRALSEAAHRLVLIANLNRKLHDPANAGIDLKDFLRGLCEDVSKAAGIDNPGCNVHGPEGIPLPADKAVPLALIVAELLNNSIEHGFADGKAGTLQMNLERAGDAVVLTVRDDGRGLPPGFDLAQAKSLGLRIVQGLVQQIGARLEMFSDQGTSCRLTFAP
ncbi:MAG TPA: histidine kinase dimerization/phosphoacceptor domain -containing protein [Beijerinckiaceae bacterium]|nr:histidine kinase dimerization/phosphoacceptor domain -containing protein [Beijerinckiaceae bacterium]